MPRMLFRTSEIDVSRRLRRKPSRSGRAPTAAAAAGLATALFFSPGSAHAQSDSGSEHDEPGRDSYLDHIGTALEQASAGSYREALSAVRQAKATRPGDAYAQFLEGSLLNLLGETDAAEGPFRACLARAEGQDGRLFARCLIGVARILESDTSRLSEARALWQRYKQFALGQVEFGLPSLADARIEAIDTMRERLDQSRQVRERIEAREQQSR